MAVVQISRIQIRRGTANGGTGLPQLASGEMAWAVDTQQLFIGNGAVSEGAPAVGNTRILTTADISSYGNLLSTLTYVYQANNTSVPIITGISSNYPVARTFQQRLDDQVTTLEFGARGDGVGTTIATDDTAALQRAINQLFLNPVTTSSTYSSSYPTGTPAAVGTRKKLEIPAGIYCTSQPLYIPSYATLIGAGADKTIISYNSTSTYVGSTVINSTVISLTSATMAMVGASISGTNIPSSATIVSVVVGVSVTLLGSVGALASGSNITFTITLITPAIQFINDSSTIGHPSDITATTSTTQPRNIKISNLTVNSISGTNTCLQLDSVKDSIFEDLILSGNPGSNWNGTINASQVGVLMRATSSLVTCDHNIFRNIVFDNFSYAVYAMYDITNNIFEDCSFNNGLIGVSLGNGSNGATSGQVTGPLQTQFVNCKFYNIKQQAVYLYRGYGNSTVNCKLINVGNNGAGNTGAVYPQIYWNSYGNSSINDWSDRNGDLSTNVNIATPYVPEMGGHGIYKSFGMINAQASLQGTGPGFLFRLPVSMTSTGSPTGTINYKIQYYYQSSVYNFSRQGIISISANISGTSLPLYPPNPSPVTGPAQLQVDDEYDFAGTDTVPNLSGVIDNDAVQLSFTGSFLTQSGATYTGAAGQVPYSIAIYYSNSLSTDTGVFGYSYTAIQ